MKISIITATYNSENSIERCLDSVKNQSYDNIEHIIIDGFSTDSTLDKIHDSNFKGILITEKDRGIYDALNKGISKASGDLIGLLHSDDTFYSKDTLRDLAQFTIKNAFDGVYGDLIYTSANHKGVVRYWKAGTFARFKLKYGWMPPHPTVFLKKSIYEDIGYYNFNLKIAADYDFLLRLLLKEKYNIGYLQKVITNMRLGGASNKNFVQIRKKMKEDYLIIKNNKVGGLWVLLLKNLIKIPQLFLKKNQALF